MEWLANGITFFPRSGVTFFFFLHFFNKYYKYASRVWINQRRRLRHETAFPGIRTIQKVVREEMMQLFFNNLFDHGTLQLFWCVFNLVNIDELDFFVQKLLFVCFLITFVTIETCLDCASGMILLFVIIIYFVAYCCCFLCVCFCFFLSLVFLYLWHAV